MKEFSLKEIVRAARERHIPIPAFNVPYLPMMRPIVETLQGLDCFGLVEVARPEVEKFEAQSFRAVAEEFERHADRGYTRLHQDHVPVIDEDGERADWEGLIREALDLGYDSVMVDGSRLPLEENIRVSRTVVEMAHAKGVPAEAELGAVFGHEAGPPPSYEELFSSGRGFTKVDEAGRFVEETGVDWLSVAVGSIHGAISGVAKDRKKVEARLDIEHLRKLADATRIPLVLHGGSGIERESVLAAVRNGITKINVGTAIRQVYEKGLKEKGDMAFAQECVSREVEDLVKNYYRIQGSASRLAVILRERGGR